MPIRKSNNKEQISVAKIRVSSGSAIVLGLMEGVLNAKPTTAYLLTYIESKCMANCGFCSQAKNSESRADRLSRVAWPVFATKQVLPKLRAAIDRKEIARVCIQALNYPTILEDLLALVKSIKYQRIDVPISVSCQPLEKSQMTKLAEAGIQRIGIALDAATESIFNRVKGSLAGGPYDWNRQRAALLEALEVFGKNGVSTHLIVGLGETEREMIETIQWCVDHHIYPALFAFTPIHGIAMENSQPPTINRYRRIQLARYFLVHGMARFEEMIFGEKGLITGFGASRVQVRKAIQSGKPFLTSGCPNCNRPYYNEKPSGPIYNFPESPTQSEIKRIENQLGFGD
ncbi:MAG: radical SAM protein [Candidatus Bathyarchaeota archaeon]|nr:MAG: radical SAM protein [Candidatus Bathyarchaeota archaeon]